jgi:hypothetical protein
MVKKTKIQYTGFTLEITPQVAEALGVNNPDDLRIIMQEDKVILRAKKVNPEHIAELQKKDKALTDKIIKKFAPVLKKLAKT